MGTFYIENFGCRATQADGAALERQFLDRGLERVRAADAAEVVVLNTCTVTAAADQDARAAIRRVNRANPKAKIVVTGCYAQRAPEEIAALPGVSQVIGNSHKHELAAVALRQPAFVPIERLAVSGQPSAFNEFGPEAGARSLEPAVIVSDIFAHTELLAAPVFDAANERTRPNLKVQDGCDNRCAFCVIPFVRGQSRSLPLERVIEEANALVNAGYRELVISGINLGRWGRDLAVSARSSAISGSLIPEAWDPKPNQQLSDLVHAVLARTTLEKLRVSSVEPMDWSDELISLMATSARIAKHAHVPMQSGSDAVLRRMHRKYRPWHYREKILKLREAMPLAAIGADVMVGFPGETDREFDETRRMIEDLPFTYLHVFTYSARPGTPAAEMKTQVPTHVARDRNRILRELAALKKLTFMRSLVGKKIDAITLKRGADTPVRTGGDSQLSASVHTEALTDNYVKLRLLGRFEPNQWVTATVGRVEGGELVGL